MGNMVCARARDFGSSRRCRHRAPTDAAVVDVVVVVSIRMQNHAMTTTATVDCQMLIDSISVARARSRSPAFTFRDAYK